MIRDMLPNRESKLECDHAMSVHNRMEGPRLVKERRWLPRPILSAARPGFTTLRVVLVALGVAGQALADDAPIRLSDAAEQGTFNVGAAQASLSRVFDSTVGGEVLKLQYNLPPGTAAGVWTKGFPESLSAGGVDVVRLAARLPDPAQLGSIAVALEVKGTAGVQRIALHLQDGWSFHETRVDWPAIGKVNEVVVLVNQVGDRTTAPGTFASVDVDVRFGRLSWPRWLSTTSAGRIAGVVVLGLLGALCTSLMRRLSRTREQDGTTRGASETSNRVPAPSWSSMARDFVQGAGVVFIAILAIGVYALGDRSPLEAGWTALGVAAAGAAVGQWWKRGLTRTNLTAAEVFQDLFATGLLAAASSPLVILQPPSAWPEVLLLSQTVAAAATIVYHAANAARLATSGRHLSAALGALIVGTPFVVGGLTLLESSALLQALGEIVTARTLAAWPTALEVVGRVVVVFAFNVVVAGALSLATKRTWLRSLPAYLSLINVAVAVVAAPWIAAYGSSVVDTSRPAVLRLIVAVLTTIVSQAGLWAEGYLITGLVLDAINGRAPSRESSAGHPLQGMTKGAVYSGTFMAILYGLPVLWNLPGVRELAGAAPLLLAILFGALAFPLLKSIIETFDGSQAFFRRVGRSYCKPILYLRGAVVGLGLGFGLTRDLTRNALPARVWFGLAVGVAAFAGVNFLRDAIAQFRGQGRVQTWRLYLVHSLLGGFIGAAIGFYLDATQVAVIVAKYHRYLGSGWTPEPFGERPLLSKWGFINLGTVNGGVSLLFCEALAGVISWSIPAWLFALNKTFMAAYFRKETTPIRALFTHDGMTQLTQNMIEVLRWGLWMSPIIKSFLRPMGDPTWYNQDGAIRTVWVIMQDLRLSPAEFRAWSLQVFIALLAYDSVRILIWLDHMGLRVATLVNLSFLGMDKLESRLARFLSPAATARCIPEAVKRFTTWAPLLIPYYIPRGRDWDVAWDQSQILQQKVNQGPIAELIALPRSGQLLALAGAIATCTAVFALIRRLSDRFGTHRRQTWSLINTEYEVLLGADCEVRSRTRDRGYDVSRRSYDLIDPSGRTLFLVDNGEDPRAVLRSWPVLGNYPHERAAVAHCERSEQDLTIGNTHADLRTTVAISLPGPGDPVELWTIAVENLRAAPRRIKVLPYLEWVLNRPDADRGHTQYNRRDGVRSHRPTPCLRDKIFEGDGHPRRRCRSRRVPHFANRFHRPGPQPLDAPGARDPGVHGTGRHRRAPHL